MMTTVIRDNVEIKTLHFVCFDRIDAPGCGWSFPCDPNGQIDSDLPQIAKDNYAKCINGVYNVRPRGVEKCVQKSRLCPCGSGKHPEDVYDARGIYLARVCDKCRRQKLSKYRADVLHDSNYWHDEPISEDNWDY